MDRTISIAFWASAIIGLAVLGRAVLGRAGAIGSDAARMLLIALPLLALLFVSRSRAVRAGRC